MRLLQNDMLLTSESARTLFEKTANSGIARADRAFLHTLAQNKVYQTPTDLWIAGNPHAVSLLRHAGAEEVFVGGNGSDYEKFRAFCTVMGDSAANPLKLQIHFALRKVFGCSLVLHETNCEQIWQAVCERLSRENITPQEYVKGCGIDTVLASLAPWEDLADVTMITDPRVLPVFAPDAYFLPTGKEFSAAVRALGTDISDWKSFCKALEGALDRFAQVGCRVAAQSVLPAEFCRPNEYHAALYFEKALAGEVLSGKELALYQAQLWRVLSAAYTARDMTVELCVGETPAKSEISNPVSGVFSAKAARELFDYLKERVGLPRVAVYTEQAALIPTVTALAGRYPAIAEGVPQIALGVWQGAPADTRAQLRALASSTALSACVGALPDMRLPLSPWSNEILCRILCAELADWEAHGEACVGEESLCRIIARLTGENMRAYYKL